MGYFFHEVYVTDISNILIAMPILLLVWSVIGVVLNKYMRVIGLIAAVLVVAVILYQTVFARGSSHAKVDFIPLSSFERAKTQPEMYRSMLMNVFLFVPLGLSLPYVLGDSSAKRILLTILVGFLLSAAVEAIQYFFKLGMAETDDIICNTLGVVLGSCAYPLSLLWRKMINTIKKRESSDE